MYVEYKITRVYHFAKIACTMISMIKRIKAYTRQNIRGWSIRGNTRKSLGNFRAIRVYGRHRINCHKCTLDFWGRLGAFSSENSNPQSDIQRKPSEFRVNKETRQRKETRRLERMKHTCTRKRSNDTRLPKAFHPVPENSEHDRLHTERIIGTIDGQRKSSILEFNFLVVFDKFFSSQTQ